MVAVGEHGTPFLVGGFQCIAVSDGCHRYENPLPLLLANASFEQLEEALAGHGVEPGEWTEFVSPYTCLVVDTGRHVVLVDTGTGSGLDPDSGQLLDNLKVEGISPGDIDTVILTHGHPDHIGGAVDDRGRPVYPNARYVMTHDEWEFWTTPKGETVLASLKIDEGIKGLLLDCARTNLLPLQGEIDLVDPEAEVVPGIRLIPASGHTPGQVAPVVSSGNKHLIYISDAAVHPVHLERPQWHMAVDCAPQAALATRRRLLKMAEGENNLVFGFHLPRVGLGRAIRRGEGWRWHPLL